MDFWLVEEIKSDFFEKHSSMKFPKHRIIRLILEDTEVEKNRDFIEFFDELLLSSISNTQVDRWIPCQECNENQEAGFFHAAQKFVWLVVWSLSQPSIGEKSSLYTTSSSILLIPVGIWLKINIRRSVYKGHY